MKKFLLGAFIVFDLALMSASAYVLHEYLGRMTSRKSPGLLRVPAGTVKSATAPSTSTLTSNPAATAGGPITVPANVLSSTLRNILFTYRNSHARQVSIRADFTGWKAEPMEKGTDGVWKYQAHLSPGEYAYCYTVDDKTFKDPDNKRTKQIGRTMVSSILVEPLTAKPLP